MAIVTLVLGESGTGKSASLRNMDPAHTLLLQAIKKPLPFRNKAWGYISPDNKAGNIIVTDRADQLLTFMSKTKRKVIILDDFQYTMSNEFMRRTSEHGFQKFTDIGKSAWDVFNAAAGLPDDVRVYILAHTTTDELGHTKIKTIGKMLDEKICLEGMVSIVLRTQVTGGEYGFATKNNGSDTVKTPLGMFEEATVDNDLSLVDQAIIEYYNIHSAA